eukprot:1568993-Prymnesium_polylepis.1
MYAIAHALHDIFHVQNKSEVFGYQLKDTLLRHVRFEGVTGLVSFSSNGNREMGVQYSLGNYVDAARGWVPIGRWTPCESAGCTFSTRFATFSSAADLTYSTQDNSKPAGYSCTTGAEMLRNGSTVMCICSAGYEQSASGIGCTGAHRASRKSNRPGAR